MICPKCRSNKIVKNGSIHNGKPKFKCNNCNRPLVENPKNKRISPEIKLIIDKLLLERISLAGIGRATGVSQDWLYSSIKDKYIKVSRTGPVKAKKKGKLVIQLDELWSFVKHKNNKQWVWIAIDKKTHEIVGLHLGNRSQKSARELWNSLPAVYRQCAVCYPDFRDSYPGVLPKKRHRPVNKNSGKMNLIERFNCTLRQRVSRLVRKSLSFSNDLSNHIGAIWYFVHNYNSSLKFL